MGALSDLIAQARACTVCAAHLPLGPRPIFRVSSTAKIMITSQAPGTKAHNSGVPFDDASGERLRDWMGLTPEQFYDASRIAIMPMGFCYPGRLQNGGDAPPRPECAPLWHDRFLAQLPQIELTILIGGYAQTRYLGPGNMTQRVQEFARHPKYFAMPHPSWRTIGWEKRNPWFVTNVLPALKNAIAALN